MAKRRFGYYERLFSLCRQEWSRNCPTRKQVLSVAKRKVEGFDKFLCATCGGFYAYSDVQIDHRTPINNTKPESYDDLIACLYLLHTDKLDVLCKPCHKFKSKLEAAERAKQVWATIIAQKMNLEPEFVLHQLEDHAILKKIGMVVKKLEKATGFKQAMYTDKLEKHIKKYF